MSLTYMLTYDHVMAAMDAFLDGGARGDDGLFVQPRDSGPGRERDETRNRRAFVSHFDYADRHAGLSSTYDVQGRYNCGRCAWADGGRCRLVDVDIDRERGSCGDWDTVSAPHSFPYKTADSSGYGVSRYAEGFGCRRCPYASRAYAPDALGRGLYCGKGDFRVGGDACCVLNGATRDPS